MELYDGSKLTTELEIGVIPTSEIANLDYFDAGAIGLQPTEGYLQRQFLYQVSQQHSFTESLVLDGPNLTLTLGLSPLNLRDAMSTLGAYGSNINTIPEYDTSRAQNQQSMLFGNSDMIIKIARYILPVKQEVKN